MARAALTPEERAALNDRLEKGRAVAAANRAAGAASRAALAEQREISQIQAQARFAQQPPAELPERDQDLARARAAAKEAAEPRPPVMPPIVHEGDVAPPRVVAPPIESEIEHEIEQSAVLDDFERFLAAQDAETRAQLPDVELRVIFETETKRAQDERKAAARKVAAARAQRHAKSTAGLLPAEAVAAAALRDRLAQKVEWTVNVPEAGNSGMLIDEGIRFNGRLLRHGERVTGSLAEYETYRSIEWNAHQNELDFQGRGKMSKLRQTATGFLNMRGAA